MRRLYESYYLFYRCVCRKSSSNTIEREMNETDNDNDWLFVGPIQLVFLVFFLPCINQKAIIFYGSEIFCFSSVFL